MIKCVSFCPPARYVFGVMGMLGVTVAYVMRACLSIAITQMVKSAEHSSNFSTPKEDVCPDPDNIDTRGQSLLQNYDVGQFDWSEEKQGVILSAFYFGYIVTHIPGGLLAQRFGGKYTLGLGILWTAIFTLLTPIVAYQGDVPLIILRFLEGLGEGTTFPALCIMLAQWTPPSERSTISTAAFAGVHMGVVVANFFGGMILQYMSMGWEAVFYIFGAVGVIWFLLWMVLCYNDPNSHPFISEKEKLYLKEAIGQIERKKDLGPMPWKSILTSVPVWALVAGEIGHDWALYTMVSDLPKYMNDVLKFNFAENGVLSALPYLATLISSLVLGTLVDFLLKRKIASATFVRKFFGTIGSVGPSIGIMCASYMACDRNTATIFFIIGMGCMGAFYCSLRVNSLDLSPNYSGTIMALMNGAGCVSGMLTPYFTGVLTPNSTVKEWRMVFLITGGVLVVTNFVYLFFGSGDLQPWNEPSGEESKKNDEDGDA